MRSLTILALAGALAAQTAAPPARTTAPAPRPTVKSLKIPPLKQVTIPEVTTVTLKNGMKLYLLENRQLPLVSGFALIRTGNLFDPKEKIGLADVTGSVMRTGGTKAKTGDQLNEQLENIAASVESSIGESSGRVGFNCLKENTDEVLGVFHDVLTGPEFRQDKLDLARTQEKSGISRRNDDQGQIARREFAGLVYGNDSPYGWDAEYATIDAIQREDLVAFHKRYFFPKNTLLAVYGDFDKVAMQAKVEKLFEGWTVEQPPVPAFTNVDKTPKPGLNLAIKQDVTQTELRIGHIGQVLLKDADTPSIEILDGILGGGAFSSRLFKKIRQQSGFAYSIFSNWGTPYTQPGIFAVGGSVNSKDTVASVKMIQTIIEDLKTKPVSDAELKDAKDQIVNSFVFNFDTPSKTLSRLVNYEYNGYPRDFIFQHQKAVEAVTKEDVLRVAQKYLKPENFTYVLVGKPSDFSEPLSALGMPVKEIDLAIPEPKKTVAAADDSSLAAGKALLDKAVAAIGGAAKLNGITDVTQMADVAISSGGGQMAAKQKNVFLPPSTYRQESTLPFGTVVVYTDGKGGWLKTPQGEQPLAGPVMQQMQGQLFRDFLSVMKSNSSGRKVNALGGGVVEITEGAMTTKLTIDEKTGMPLKQMYTSPGMGGAPTEVEETYSDFKEFNGLKLPTKITVLQGGKPAATTTITEWKLNSGLKAEDVAKKP